MMWHDERANEDFDTRQLDIPIAAICYGLAIAGTFATVTLLVQVP